MYPNHAHRPTVWRYLALLALVGLGSDACAKDTAMTTAPEENKAIVRRVITEGVNTGDLQTFRDMLASDYARHSQATTEMPEIHGVEEMLTFLQAQFAAFPDYHEEIELMIAEGDKVAYITTGTGTQTGPLGDIPPTGKKMEVVNYVVQRIHNGKITETWIGWDNLAVLLQLGLFPPPGAGAE
jgi:predicted ester cyclase